MTWPDLPVRNNIEKRQKCTKYNKFFHEFWSLPALNTNIVQIACNKITNSLFLPDIGSSAPEPANLLGDLLSRVLGIVSGVVIPVEGIVGGVVTPVEGIVGGVVTSVEGVVQDIVNSVDCVIGGEFCG